MKITAFNGSHKKSNSNTSVLVEWFLDGAREAGAAVEHVKLATCHIGLCTACKACWNQTPGKCVINDDMACLVQKFIESDTVVFASPIYVDNVSGLLKTFLDRLIVVGDPHWEFDENNESRHRRRYDKPAGILAISNCGYPEQSHFDVQRLFYRRMCRNMHMKLAGEIYQGAGALLSGIVPEFSEFVKNYQEMVHTAGQEVARTGMISDILQTELEKPLIPLPGFNRLFLEKVNSIVDAAIAR
jgi:FMN-dependent NADH-azoreductase